MQHLQFILMEYICAVTVDWLWIIRETERAPFVLVVRINSLSFITMYLWSLYDLPISLSCLQFVCFDIYVKPINDFVNNANMLIFDQSFTLQSMFGKFNGWCKCFSVKSLIKLKFYLISGLKFIERTQK